MAAAVVVACTSKPVGSPQLVVASVRQPATALFFVAEAAGCFPPDRLRIQEHSFDLGRDALTLLREGRADVAVAYEAPLLRAALEDDRLRVLTKLHTSTRNTRLVTRASARIGAFSDLPGRRVALTRGTNSEFFSDLALRLGAVSHDAIQIVDLEPARAVDALRDGDVDAAILSDPFAQHAEEALGADARSIRTDLYVEASLLITRADVVAARERELRALLQGLACADRRALSDPDGARSLIRSRFPDVSPPALAAQVGRVSWGVGLDNVLLDVMRRERDWLVASTPGAVTPDLRRLIDPRLIDEVDPESVMLLPAPGGLRW